VITYPWAAFWMIASPPRPVHRVTAERDSLLGFGHAYERITAPHRGGDSLEPRRHRGRAGPPEHGGRCADLFHVLNGPEEPRTPVHTSYRITPT
jgi:hypothetical protein